MSFQALQIRQPELFSSMTEQAPICSPESSSYEWDFGCIALPEKSQNSSLLDLLSTPDVITHVVRTQTFEEILNVTMNSKDFYLYPNTTRRKFAVKFQLIIPSQKVVWAYKPPAVQGETLRIAVPILTT